MMRSGLFIRLYKEYGNTGAVWHTESAEIVVDGGHVIESAIYEIPEKWEPRTMLIKNRIYTIVRVNGMSWNLDNILTTKNGRPAITIPGRGARKAYTLKAA